MKMLFKQKVFSWLDSYDIFDEAGNTLYTVKSKLAWGHCLKIYDSTGNEVGTVREKVLTWLPKFEMYEGEVFVGEIRKEFSFLRPKFTVDCSGWNMEGNWVEWDYSIVSSSGQPVATVSKQLWKWSDTYAIDVNDPANALRVLMLVLAIDAEKCSRSN